MPNAIGPKPKNPHPSSATNKSPDATVADCVAMKRVPSTAKTSPSARSERRQKSFIPPNKQAAPLLQRKPFRHETIVRKPHETSALHAGLAKCTEASRMPAYASSSSGGLVGNRRSRCKRYHPTGDQRFNGHRARHTSGQIRERGMEKATRTGKSCPIGGKWPNAIPCNKRGGNCTGHAGT